MDPISAGLGAVSNIASGVFGAISSAKQRQLQREAAELAQKGVGELQGGTGYDPNKALEFLGLTDKSAYENQDPRVRDQSLEALNQLVKRGSGSGLDIQSKQALSEASARSGGAQRAARGAILQEYLNKGGEASGGTLAAMLGGQQAAYGENAAASGAASAAAEQRRLEANVLASRAGQGQQGIDQAKAAAIDALRRFNVGAKQGTLGLEQTYRQGAANVYDSAGKTMAGLAGQPNPMAAMPGAINQAAQGAKGVYDMFTGGNPAPSAGAGTGWEPPSGSLGNTQLQQPSAPGNYQYGNPLPQTQLKKEEGAW